MHKHAAASHGEQTTDWRHQVNYILCFICFIYTCLSYAETITIAAEDDWAPYSSIKADKSGPEGLAPELIKKVFKLKGIDVQYVTLPFARCMYYTLIGKTVGCFDATVTKENKNQYYWHKSPMFTEGLSVFAKSDSKDQHVELKDMEGKMVGYTIGYTYSPEILQNKKIKMFGVTSDHNQLNMLVNGRIQYALINTTPGIMIVNKDPKLSGKVKLVGRLSDDNFWIAFSKNHPDGKRLTETFESGLELFKSSGEYDKMMKDFRSHYIIH